MVGLFRGRTTSLSDDFVSDALGVFSWNSRMPCPFSNHGSLQPKVADYYVASNFINTGKTPEKHRKDTMFGKVGFSPKTPDADSASRRSGPTAKRSDAEGVRARSGLFQNRDFKVVLMSKFNEKLPIEKLRLSRIQCRKN